MQATTDGSLAMKCSFLLTVGTESFTRFQARVLPADGATKTYRIVKQHNVVFKLSYVFEIVTA